MAGGFLSRLFGSPRGPEATIEDEGGQPLADGERVYAIGDLHGCAHLLDAMHDVIRADLRGRPAKAEIVYLGDYVDRGPDTSGVLDRLAFPAPDLPPTTALMGNHESVFLEFLDGADVSEALRSFGGWESLRSYGIEPTEIPGRAWIDAARDRLETRMPAAHRALLNGLAFFYDRPPYFFCHAGVRPGVPVLKQEREDLIWIRNDFLRSKEDFGRIVVHGHTPVSAPDVRKNRVNVDTGAYKTGVLSCAVLELDAINVISTDGTNAF